MQITKSQLRGMVAEALRFVIKENSFDKMEAMSDYPVLEQAAIQIADDFGLSDEEATELAISLQGTVKEFLAGKESAPSNLMGRSLSGDQKKSWRSSAGTGSSMSFGDKVRSNLKL